MSFRIRGFLIHLAASITLAVASIAIVFLLWYPSPLEKAIGVTSIFLLLLGVDVVIGPLLTLAVCKEGKKSLKLDLAVIIALQLGAFFYGFYTIAQGRPVWIAFNTDRFDVVQAFEMNHPYREKAAPEFRGFSLTGPAWVAVTIPSDKNVIADGLMKGVDIPQRADFYEPLARQAMQIKEKSKPVAELSAFNDPQLVKKIIAKYPEATGFLPLMGQVKPVTVLIVRETGAVVAIVDLSPWK